MNITPLRAIMSYSNRPAPRPPVWWMQPEYALDGVPPVFSADFSRDRYMLLGRAVSVQSLFTRNGGVKRVVGADGMLTEVPANTLAFDYSSGRRRMVLEGASSNLRVNSEEVILTGSDGSSTSLLVAGEVLSPFTGKSTVVRVNAAVPITRVGYYAYGPGGWNTALVNTFSFFAKAGDNVQALGGWIAPDASATNPIAFKYDLTTKQIVMGVNVANVSVVELAHGWYRFAVTNKPNTTLSQIFVTAYQIDKSIPSHFYYTGIQTENSPVATSYIPTTTAAATRVGDVSGSASALDALVNGRSLMTAAIREQVTGPLSTYAYLNVGRSIVRGLSSTSGRLVSAGDPPASNIQMIPVVVPGEFGCVTGWDDETRTTSVNNSDPITAPGTVTPSYFRFSIGSGIFDGSRYEIDEALIWPIYGSPSAIQAQARVYA